MDTSIKKISSLKTISIILHVPACGFPSKKDPGPPFWILQGLCQGVSRSHLLFVTQGGAVAVGAPEIWAFSAPANQLAQVTEK